MPVRTPLLAILLVSGITGHTALADTATTGAPNVRANRIVGLWITHGAVSPCDTGVPTIPVRNHLLFHSGGTVTENIPPPTAAPIQRNTGLGTWSYDPATGWYAMHLQFDTFLNGVLSGSTRVDRMLLLSADGLEAAGSVRVTRYALDGSVTQELCGEAASERLL